MKNKVQKFVAVIFVTASMTSCEMKKSTEVQNGDSSSTVTEKTTRIGFSRDVFRVESDSVKSKLERLKDKAVAKGDKAGENTKREIEELDNERKQLELDSTDEKFSEKWEKFKQKVKNRSDSLDSKI